MALAGPEQCFQTHPDVAALHMLQQMDMLLRFLPGDYMSGNWLQRGCSGRTFD